MHIIIVLLALILIALVAPKLIRGLLLFVAGIADFMLLPITGPKRLTEVTMGGLLAPLLKHRVVGLIAVVALGSLGLLLASKL
jgi:hypothetical protein